MALYIPHSIFHLARLLCVRPESLDTTTYVCLERKNIPLGNLRHSEILLISDGKHCIRMKCRSCKILKRVALCCFGYMLTLPSTYDRLTGHFRVPGRKEHIAESRVSLSV